MSYEGRRRRVATMIFFLSDVPTGGGGETFFSFARNGTEARAAEELAMDEKATVAAAELAYRRAGGGGTCDAANVDVLKYRPKKGSAILFYTRRQQVRSHMICCWS